MTRSADGIMAARRRHVQRIMAFDQSLTRDQVERVIAAQGDLVAIERAAPGLIRLIEDPTVASTLQRYPRRYPQLAAACGELDASEVHGAYMELAERKSGGATRGREHR